MRKADAITQTVFLALCVITAWNVIIPMLILIGIGVYQLVTSLIALIQIKDLPARDQQLLKGYWYAVLGYFTILLSLIILEPDDEIFLVWLGIIPWVYAIYCTVITYRRAFSEDKGRIRRGKHPQHHQFLDNIDF